MALRAGIRWRRLRKLTKNDGGLALATNLVKCIFKKKTTTNRTPNALWQLSLNLDFMDWRLGRGCGDAAGKSSGSAPSIIWLQSMARGAGAEREGIQVHHCSPPSCCNQKRFDLTNVAGWSSNTECWHSAPKMMGWCQAVMTLMRSQLYEFSTWKARWNVSIIRWIYFTCLSRKEPMETHDTFGAPKSDFLTTAGSAR